MSGCSKAEAMVLVCACLSARAFILSPHTRGVKRRMLTTLQLALRDLTKNCQDILWTNVHSAAGFPLVGLTFCKTPVTRL